jgi:excisionase family DNA binding protein
MSAYLSAREAADYCGVSEKTIRNWLASGRISAEKSAGAFRIPQAQLEAFRRDSAGDSAEDPQGADRKETAVRADGAEVLTAAQVLELIRETQAQLIAKSEAAAMWQARAELLASELARAREEVKLLAAPKETDEKSSERPPWWKFWART